MRIVGSRTRALLIERLVTHPEGRPWLRELVRGIGTGMGAIQRELLHLRRTGLIKRRVEACAVFYEVDTSHPLFEPLRGLVEASRTTDLYYDPCRGGTGHAGETTEHGAGY